MQELFRRESQSKSLRYNQWMQPGRKPKEDAPLFGQKLAYFRQKRGLTQYELADLLQISRALVGHYERNCHSPSFDFVRKVAKTLDVSADELFDLVPEKQKTGPTPKMVKLAEQISTLPKSKQTVVLEILDSYLNKAS